MIELSFIKNYSVSNYTWHLCPFSISCFMYRYTDVISDPSAIASVNIDAIANMNSIREYLLSTVES